MGTVKIKWTDPPDIATNEPVPCTWAGTVVVRKEGSAPRHRWDGTLIVDSATRDEYSVNALVDDTVEDGKTYYYGIFPYHIAVDDANNPIKHYRFTKVISVSTGNAPVPPPPEWDSGTEYSYAFSGGSWINDTARQAYEGFINSHDTIIWTNAPDNNVQCGVDPHVSPENKIPDTLFIVRATGNNYTQFDFGYRDTMSRMTKETLVNNITVWRWSGNTFEAQVNQRKFFPRIWTVSGRSLEDLIAYCFNKTPFQENADVFVGYYYLCKYVYLVDDLNTLANPEVVYPSSS